jgi:hypothetical protein
MRTRVLSPEFPDISSLRFSDGSSLIKAGTSELSDPDFIETDFKYNQGKLEFSSPNTLDELVGEDKVVIQEDTEKYLLTLFPTNTESGEGADDISYFSSSIDSNGREIICVSISEGISWVKAYDSNGVEALEIELEGSEIDFSKVITIVTSYDSVSPVSINLSWEALEGDKNPIRGMSDYVLRNDAFVRNWKGYKEENGFLFSRISSSLVGTERVEERPIYNLLCGFSDELWSRAKRYSVGDKALVGNTEFESVEANNIGNHPYYSRMWVKTGVI